MKRVKVRLLIIEVHCIKGNLKSNLMRQIAFSENPNSLGNLHTTHNLCSRRLLCRI